MRTICMAYLLLKSLFNRTFNFFDVALANALIECMWWPGMYPPAYLMMIGNLESEAKLPEAWADFRFEICAEAEEE